MKVTVEEIKALRARMKWSTYALADQIGCNQSTVCRIEGGAKFGRVIEKALQRLIDAHPEREAA
ncbi:hypothetical protein N8D56_04880 [Devosia sp. A8/3-2]|nr:hypothetical protein N8D56_04880 [Devosia sp. A8/3-2]